MEAVLNEIPIKKYPTYKDSGVRWFGDIPTHWEVSKLKFIGSIFNGDSLNEREKAKFESKTENEYPYISTKDIDLELSEITYDNGLRIPRLNNKFKIAPKDSFLLCIEGGSAGKKIGYLSQDVCFVNKLACFYIHKANFPKYYYYFAKCTVFQNQFSLSMTGLIGGVAISLIKNFIVHLPPAIEQKTIVQFLDRKTGLIDKAIAIKEKQIELLKERKQILIHKAITRGLNPNVKMKDSGVEWIGKIPEHWTVVNNRSLFNERNEPGNETLPILSVSIHTAVSSEELSEEENLRGKIRIEDKSYYKLVKENDIVFNMMRAWQGGIGAVRTKGMVSPAYIVAKPRAVLFADFFEYQYRTGGFIQQMDRHSKGITDFRKRLYWNEFKLLKTILPPLTEQKDVVNFIKIIGNKISTAITLKQKEIEKLQEYKSSLINNAVTGKIKVI